MLHVRVWNNTEFQELQHPLGPLEIGRAGPRRGMPRCIIRRDRFVSAHHILLFEQPGQQIHLENLSNTNAIHVKGQLPIPIQQARDLSLPVHLTVGETQITIDPGDPHARAFAGSGSEAEAATLTTTTVEDSLPTSLLELEQALSPETLTQLFETIIRIQRAAGSRELYQQVARAVIELIGLDRGMVILCQEGGWTVVARYPDRDFPGHSYDRTILDEVAQKGHTVVQVLPMAAEQEGVAAAPIFDSEGKVVGALYGCRLRQSRLTGRAIASLETHVLQLLASVVEVGLARQDNEKKRILLAQFFTEELVREVERNPGLLGGRECEITVLFSDIRGSSGITERLGPTDTFRLISDVLERLTVPLRTWEGVVVDYTGDGLMAMWNAPHADDRHAVKACHAALAMLRQLPELNAAWQEQIGHPLELGIGINTGVARCGNIGSQYKFKYGPLGHAVNVANRVEGATKHLGVPLLITGSTRSQLGDAFATRRICRARLPGLVDAVDLYELHGESATPGWQERRKCYEQALALYEARDWPGACRALYPLVSQDPLDIPGLNLIARSIDAIQAPPDWFDGVINVPDKSAGQRR